MRLRRLHTRHHPYERTNCQQRPVSDLPHGERRQRHSERYTDRFAFVGGPPAWAFAQECCRGPLVGQVGVGIAEGADEDRRGPPGAVVLDLHTDIGAIDDVAGTGADIVREQVPTGCFVPWLIENRSNGIVIPPIWTRRMIFTSMLIRRGPARRSRGSGTDQRGASRVVRGQRTSRHDLLGLSHFGECQATADPRHASMTRTVRSGPLRPQRGVA